MTFANPHYDLIARRLGNLRLQGDTALSRQIMSMIDDPPMAALLFAAVEAKLRSLRELPIEEATLPGNFGFEVNRLANGLWIDEHAVTLYVRAQRVLGEAK